MKRIPINTKNAPPAIGPYSQAVRAGDFLFVSGQIPVNPATGDMVSGDIAKQTSQVLNNINGILLSENLTFANVVKATVYLKKMTDFHVVNDVYASVFSENPPARECVEVSELPKHVDVEISVIAVYS